MRSRQRFQKNGAINRQISAHSYTLGCQHSPAHRMLTQSAAKTPIAAKLGEEADTIPHTAMMPRVALNPI